MKFEDFSQVKARNVIKPLSLPALRYFAENSNETGVRTAGRGKFIRVGADIYLGDQLGFPSADSMRIAGMGISHPAILKFVLEKTTGRQVVNNVQDAVAKHALDLFDYDYLITDAGQYGIGINDSVEPSSITFSGKSFAFGSQYSDISRRQTVQIAAALLGSDVQVEARSGR